ncbi:MAG: hypothetical protein HC802_09115 [Caldilineaceae bacterium]|nr:hypothetical protein [Caldilineaceae bacterium]
MEVGGPSYIGAYLLAGEIAPDLSSVTLATDRYAQIDSPTLIRNLSEEAIVATPRGILTFYEANGRALRPTPAAHLITPTLAESALSPFPSLEYRVTDATELDAAGRFWVINYFFPGDVHLRPEADPLANQFGKGPTHASYQHVERLVEMEITESGIVFTERAPIQFALSLEPRNWEGVVRLDDEGFLIVTDSFPQTMLAFVTGHTLD